MSGYLRDFERERCFLLRLLFLFRYEEDNDDDEREDDSEEEDEDEDKEEDLLRRWRCLREEEDEDFFLLSLFLLRLLLFLLWRLRFFSFLRAALRAATDVRGSDAKPLSSLSLSTRSCASPWRIRRVFMCVNAISCHGLYENIRISA